MITLQVIECRQIIFGRIHGPWFRSPYLERPVCGHVQLSNLLLQRHSLNLFGDFKGCHANQFYRLTTNQVRSVTYFNPAFFAFVICFCNFCKYLKTPINDRSKRIESKNGKQNRIQKWEAECRIYTTLRIFDLSLTF